MSETLLERVKSVIDDSRTSLNDALTICLEFDIYETKNDKWTKEAIICKLQKEWPIYVDRLNVKFKKFGISSITEECKIVAAIGQCCNLVKALQILESGGKVYGHSVRHEDMVEFWVNETP